MIDSDDAIIKIDRRIPMAVLMTLAIQLAGALIWATQLDARVSHMELQFISTGDLNEKFARLEERLENLKQNTDAMKRQLDHLSDRLLKP